MSKAYPIHEDQQQLSNEMIFEKVRKAIVDALGVEEEDVILNASLVNDLGAESIDFVDILFRLQKEFNIRLPQRSFLEYAAAQFGEGVLITETEELTDLGLTLAKQRMPDADQSKIKKGLTIEGISELITPITWVRMVQEALDAKPKECIRCGATSLVQKDPITLECKGCGEKLSVPSGDELVDNWILEFRRKYVDNS